MALVKILAKPIELLAWEHKRPNAMTWGLKFRGVSFQEDVCIDQHVNLLREDNCQHLTLQVVLHS